MGWVSARNHPTCIHVLNSRAKPFVQMTAKEEIWIIYQELSPSVSRGADSTTGRKKMWVQAGLAAGVRTYLPVVHESQGEKSAKRCRGSITQDGKWLHISREVWIQPSGHTTDAQHSEAAPSWDASEYSQGRPLLGPLKQEHQRKKRKIFYLKDLSK